MISLFLLQLTLWINEKMLTAQDTSYDEARNLHSKWLKHQAFMAELASNKGWLQNVDQVGFGLNPRAPACHQRALNRLVLSSPAGPGADRGEARV